MTYPSDRYGELWRGAGICVEDRTIDAEDYSTDSNTGISMKHYFSMFLSEVMATRWRVSGIEGTIILFDISTDLMEATRLIGISGVISHDDLKDAWPSVSEYRIGEWIGVC